MCVNVCCDRYQQIVPLLIFFPYPFFVWLSISFYWAHQWITLICLTCTWVVAKIHSFFLRFRKVFVQIENHKIVLFNVSFLVLYVFVYCFSLSILPLLSSTQTQNADSTFSFLFFVSMKIYIFMILYSNLLFVFISSEKDEREKSFSVLVCTALFYFIHTFYFCGTWLMVELLSFFSFR